MPMKLAIAYQYFFTLTVRLGVNVCPCYKHEQSGLPLCVCSLGQVFEYNTSLLDTSLQMLLQHIDS